MIKNTSESIYRMFMCLESCEKEWGSLAQRCTGIPLQTLFGGTARSTLGCIRITECKMGLLFAICRAFEQCFGFVFIHVMLVPRVLE